MNSSASLGDTLETLEAKKFVDVIEVLFPFFSRRFVKANELI